MISLILSIFGGITISFIGLHVVRLIYVHFIRPKTNLKKYGAGNGYWAAVTGSSDGIGKSYALQLAKAGFNVMLISRTQSKLTDVANEIKTASPKVETKVITIDLAKATDADWKRLQQEFSSVKLGMLVNNAGMSHEMPEKFGDADLQRVRDIINVNIVAVNELTRAALPALLKNQQANMRGLILNVGSASGLLPTPLLAVYAASKAYLSSWSTGIQREYASAGVDSDCAVAFFVVSNMSKRKKPSALIPTPDTFVRSSLGKVGFGDVSLAPYFPHALLEFAIESLPSVLMSWAVDRNYVMHAGIRKAALAKAARGDGDARKK